MTTFANITCSTLLVSMLIAGADAGFRVRGGGGASGVSRISARGVLKVRPHTKSGGVVNFRSDIRKVGGGGNSLQVRYEKWGGGIRFRSDTKSGGGRGGFASDEKWGGGGRGGFASDEKWGGGGGGSPLQVRYLCLAHRKYLHVPTYVLPRYTSHARANELIIHAGKG